MTDPGHAVVISLEGTFDLSAARLVANSFGRMGVGNRVLVDFTRVRVFNDFAVAVLAQALKSRSAVHARVRGLSLHHVRLLRYFGVPAEVFRLEPAPPARRAPRPPGS